MKMTSLRLTLVFLVFSTFGVPAWSQSGAPREGRQDQGKGRANARQTDPDKPPPFHTKVPDHPWDIILGRPTDTSITVSVVSYEAGHGRLTYGRDERSLDEQTPTLAMPVGKAVEWSLDSLQPDTTYFYKFHRRLDGQDAFTASETHRFHTQRAKGRPFVFTIQADSHLDLASDPDCYVRTLRNALDERPDFHIDLGDTFMTDKFARYTDAITQYRAQRFDFGQLCHSSPLFMVLGNHDGESGAFRNGTANNMTVWSANTRKAFFPNPYPDRFYSGNEADEPFVGKPADYYAWTWGDGLFMVLDPFWYTTTKRGRGDDHWGWTLGEAQYRWLKKTLQSSDAKFKFLFIHHLVGGATPEARGGSEASAFFEWGGRDLDGTDSFARRRPGWGKPIHDLLVENHVTAVFHGHDHFYARQERDGIVYQLVPQPGNPRYGMARGVDEYSYREGDLRAGPGHLRVSVAPDRVAVAYMLTVLPKDERADRTNAKVVTEYTIAGGRRSEATPAGETRPNFVFLIGEGQGWSSLSAPMDDRVPDSKSVLARTPNLDSMARDGMRFTNFRAPSPRCTPSRAAFFTGKGPAALHMTFVGEGRGDLGGGEGTKVIPPRASTELPQSETTIAESLKAAGYMTAHFGKWHVGRTDPARHGYDENDGPNANGGPEDSAHPNPKQAYAIAKKGADFMEKAVKAGKPFYLQIAQYAGNSEADATPETYAAVTKRLGGREVNRLGALAVAEDADKTYGTLLKKLEDLGIAKNTYVIYTTDHGTPGRNPPLSGGKGTIGEGGLRVPMLVRGPGVAAGSFARQWTSGLDIFPTIADLAGVDISDVKGLEGGTLTGVLRRGGEGTIARPRPEFVVHFPHYDKDALGPASAIYLGDFKLVRLYETDQRRLYDLAKDPGERVDLATKMPEKAAELDQRMTAYLESVKAQMPTMNPIPDPSKAASTLPGDRRGGRGKGANKAKR